MAPMGDITADRMKKPRKAWLDIAVLWHKVLRTMFIDTTMDSHHRRSSEGVRSRVETYRSSVLHQCYSSGSQWPSPIACVKLSMWSFAYEGRRPNRTAHETRICTLLRIGYVTDVVPPP